MLKPDDLIAMFDRGLRTVFGTPQSLRPVPGEALEETRLDDSQRRLSASFSATWSAGSEYSRSR